MTVFRRFIRTGDSSCLKELLNEIQVAHSKIDVGDKLKIAIRLLELLPSGIAPGLERQVLVCLDWLTKFSANKKDASAVFDRIEVHPACADLLSCAARALASSDATDDMDFLHRCLQLLSKFASQNSNRREMLYQNDSLIQAIMHYCISDREVLPFHTKNCLMGILGSLLNYDMAELGPVGRETWGTEKETKNLTTLLRHGGQKAVMCVVASVLTNSCGNPMLDQGGWQIASNMFGHMLKVFTQCRGIDVLTSLVTLDETTLLTTLAPALHRRLQEGPHPMGYLVQCICAIGLQLASDQSSPMHTTERFFFYKAVTADDAKSLLRIFYEASIACNDTYCEGCALRVIDCIQTHAFHLADRIDAEVLAVRQEMQPAKKDDKDRHCAYPSCIVNGEGLVGSKMMKCGRCLAVYYCSKEHQVQHWREHRRDCAAAAK
jgi:hypothetical protein